MRITNSQTAARPQFYDRNAVPASAMYSAGGVAPHGTTTRWTYTVPAGKKAWVDAVCAELYRDVAAAAAAIAAVNINYQANGGGGSVLCQAAQSTNALVQVSEFVFTQFGYMGPGDIVYATTLDTSTGGSNAYTASIKRTEYDA